MGVQLWPGALSSETLRRLPSLGGGKQDGIIAYGYIYHYNGIWYVDSNTDSAGITSAGLVFNTGVLTVYFSGFSTRPVPGISAIYPNLHPIIGVVSVSTLELRWYDINSVFQTVPSNFMAVYLHLIGT